jgi:septum site-determining protein MinC
MSVKPEGKTSVSAPHCFEIKSSQLSTVALMLKSDDIALVTAELLGQFGPESDNPDFFERDAVLMDLSVVEPDASYEAFVALLDAVRQCHLVPVATRNAPSAWSQSLLDMGLVEAPAEVKRVQAKAPIPVATEEMATQVVEVVREVAGPGTMVVDKPLRSGQKVYARGADLVVLAMVNQGAEVVADGNIHVYAPLRGKAMAGARGNTHARIFSTCLEPELISIAGVYRTSETPLPKEIAGKAAQVRLSTDGQENLIIEPLKT